MEVVRGRVSSSTFYVFGRLFGRRRFSYNRLIGSTSRGATILGISLLRVLHGFNRGFHVNRMTTKDRFSGAYVSGHRVVRFKPRWYLKSREFFQGLFNRLRSIFQRSTSILGLHRLFNGLNSGSKL